MGTMTKIKLLLLVPVLALAACSKSENDGNIQEYFISGSTQAFYRNAKLNKDDSTQITQYDNPTL